MKFFVLFTTLFLSYSAHSSNIHMHENGAPMFVQPVEIALVMGNEIQIRSSTRPCAHYPGYPDKIYGDIYECHTSRERLQAYTGDNKMFELHDQALAEYLVKSNYTFDCATRSKSPPLVKYKGRNVYWFTGVLLTKVQ